MRVLYSRNSVRGQWGAHGRYLARETREADSKTVGFSHNGQALDVSKRLDGWQKAGDERVWKLIISPEFGDRIDLNRLTRRQDIEGMALRLITFQGISRCLVGDRKSVV